MCFLVNGTLESVIALPVVYCVYIYVPSDQKEFKDDSILRTDTHMVASCKLDMERAGGLTSFFSSGSRSFTGSVSSRVCEITSRRVRCWIWQRLLTSLWTVFIRVFFLLLIIRRVQ